MITREQYLGLMLAMPAAESVGFRHNRLFGTHNPVRQAVGAAWCNTKRGGASHRDLDGTSDAQVDAIVAALNARGWAPPGSVPWTVEALVGAMRATGKPGITGPFDALFGENTPARVAVRAAFCGTIATGATYAINGGSSVASEAELAAICTALNTLGVRLPMPASGGGDWSRARVLGRLKAVGVALPQAGIYGLFAAAFGDHGKAACEAWRRCPWSDERHTLNQGGASVCDNELDAVARELAAAGAPLVPPPPSVAALRAFLETYACGVTTLAFVRGDIGPHAAAAFDAGGWATLEAYLAGRLGGIAPEGCAKPPAPEVPPAPAPKADPYEAHGVRELERVRHALIDGVRGLAHGTSPAACHEGRAGHARAVRQALDHARATLAALPALVAAAETALVEYGGPEGAKGES